MPERGHRGLQRRAIVHLDIVEDMTGPADAPPPFPEKHDWGYGLVDGERKQRDRNERISKGDGRRDRGRRDEDDDDRDGRGRRDGRGWRDAVRRSLSRSTAGGSRDGGRRRSDNARERDRSGNVMEAGSVPWASRALWLRLPLPCSMLGCRPMAWVDCQLLALMHLSLRVHLSLRTHLSLRMPAMRTTPSSRRPLDQGGDR
jgi:hypothetical protein